MIAVLSALALAADVHQDRFAAAREAETAGRYEEAVGACREAIEAAPDGPRTPTCERRLLFLESRRDPDGGFGTWEALESVRRRWRTGDPDALAAEVEALASRPAAAPARAEIAIWLARDALSRKDDPAAALAATDRVYREEAALAGEAAVWRQIVELRAVSLARLGQVDAAREVEAAVRIPAPGAERPTPVDQVVAERRRERLAWASGAGLLLFVLPGLPLAFRGLRHRPIPAGLVPIGVAGLGAWGLTAGWDDNAGAGVPRMLGGLALVHLISLGALVTVRERPWPRRGMRVAAAVASVSVGYLALWSSGTLAWIGL